MPILTPRFDDVLNVVVPDAGASPAERLHAVVEPHDGDFEMAFERAARARLLMVKAPETDKPFFGRVDEATFIITRVPGQVRSSFQPIARGAIDGREVRVELAVHPSASNSAGFFSILSLIFAVAFLGLGVAGVVLGGLPAYFAAGWLIPAAMFGINRAITSAMFRAEVAEFGRALRRALQ